MVVEARLGRGERGELTGERDAGQLTRETRREVGDMRE